MQVLIPFSNRWHCRICTLWVQLYSFVTSVNSLTCLTKILMIVRLKCLSYSEISAILCSLFSVFYTFLFNLGKHVKDLLWGKSFWNIFSMWYYFSKNMLTLVKKNECYESCNCLSYTQKFHPQISSLALFVSKKKFKRTTHDIKWPSA